NIPFAGFHDLLCVLMTGNRITMKLSSDDSRLMPAIAALLVETEPRFDEQLRIADGKLENMDAVIATGSNNSSRYFEYYFAKYPHIIRKNRHSAAVLTGDESNGELAALCEDIFRYFGLGCRSVSKIFVPAGYDFNRFFEAAFPWGEKLIGNNKYMNNYDYNKAVYLLNSTDLLDNNFLLLKEDTGLGSPAAMVFYEYYTDQDSLAERLRADATNLQCLAGKVPPGIAPVVALGQTQDPGPGDYADCVDTVHFLLTSLAHK
ncbi:MAG: NAD-dependent aldehyde dehydrogenase, partial [Bacteroidetes bacterium]